MGTGFDWAGLTPANAPGVKSFVENFQTQLIIDSLSFTPPEFNGMLATLKAIDQSVPILIVGHSQGTIFANQLFDGLLVSGRSQKMFGVAGIAAVVPTIKGSLLASDAYVTGRSDSLVGLMNTLLPTTLSANFPPFVYGPNSDLPRHGMTESYLSDENPVLRDTVKKVLLDSVKALSFQPQAAAGVCTAPDVEFAITGTQAGWTIPPITTLNGLYAVDRDLFKFSGTTGNSCGGEKGLENGITYSQSPRISQDAAFYNVTTVTNPPDGLGGWNRRPCSTFVASKMISDPSDPANLTKSKLRIWVNATSRREQFSPIAFDRETQVRFDSGDPFSTTNGLPTGYYCQAGIALSSQFVYQPSFIPSTCKARFILNNSVFIPTLVP